MDHHQSCDDEVNKNTVVDEGNLEPEWDNECLSVPSETTNEDKKYGTDVGTFQGGTVLPLTASSESTPKDMDDAPSPLSSHQDKKDLSSRQRPPAVDTPISARDMRTRLMKEKNSPRTHCTEPISPFSSSDPPAQSTVIVEHRSGKKKRSAFSQIGKYRKLIFALIAIYTVAVTGAGVFMFKELLTIPGLNEQIERLEEQVDRLEGEVNRLTVQIDRLSGEVDRLESSNDRLEENISKLDASNKVFQELNKQLNASNIEYQLLNKEFATSNEEYRRNNENLKRHVHELSDELKALDLIKAGLNTTVVEYTALNQDLKMEVKTLSNLSIVLNNTVNWLDDQVASLREENDRLRELNANFATIASFLNETAQGLKETYETLASHLAEQIVANKEILFETLHITYRQLTTNWDCTLRSRFRLRDFVQNDAGPIGADSYEDAITFLDERVLTELCIDKQDFESFLTEDVLQPGKTLVSISLLDLESAVEQYATEVFDYYFPDNGETSGLNETEWGAADYACENLPPSKRFTRQFIF